ncbi:nucleotidyltransferase domain-containing protein [Shouchella clausii]|uniref:nucleotidyltransferase domain-containing protein n=1 Tax=Shouchella clausii TaxID=79880 RepID=UPI0020D008D0|nr:nucleotidyltransferase domain-containing protein [Shouchella clausii]MCY1104201.1 nucleotidyltransferase domain-containing protein [Shouchella clausii]MEB5478413.1 nucleotidyltransferase domain-containing protein [Shouchella clausii]MED4158887.1 nucleotidyltransferase domain-containing protein [Shouchella clausii]MED4178603.1 nucleotidyltransferase domain-containing protein [Shouchella clausii]
MDPNELVAKVGEQLKAVPGIVGIVLGGSRARGTHSADSDIDIGIYYDLSQGFTTEQLDRSVRVLQDCNKEERVVTAIGEWGEWVNAGAWLVINGYHVDLILRDITRVEQAIADCRNGAVSMHYQTGHPHGYVNAMYMGELAISRIQTDPFGKLAQLKALTDPYPTKLKQALIQFFTFEASFSLMFMEANVDKNDLSYLMGHGYRAIACLNQVLFAKNERFCINEKKAVMMISSFPRKPQHYKQRIDEAITLLSRDVSCCQQAIAQLKALLEEVKSL